MHDNRWAILNEQCKFVVCANFLFEEQLYFIMCALCSEDDDYGQDQVKVFSHEGDGENTEHLNSMDLHDIKTELERDAEKAEVSGCRSLRCGVCIH